MRQWAFWTGCIIFWVGAVVSAVAQDEVQSPSASLSEPLVIEQPPEEDGPLSLEASGTVSFGARYGFGDGRGLLQRGYSQGFQFNQLLALDLSGDLAVTLPILEIDGIFSIDAQLNSQQADNLQSLVMHFESEPLTLDFGDFFVGENAPQLIVPERKLKGFKGEWRGDSLSVIGAFARVEGLAESQTFQGNTSRDSVLFSDKQPDRPWLDQIYLRNLDGLQYFELEAGFVDGFSSVELNLHPGVDLDALLASYGLDYLLPLIQEDGPQELEEGQYQIIRDQGQTFLVLMRRPADVLRAWLRDAIDDYNLEEQLLDDDRKEYPFNENTEFELGFLDQLKSIATLDVDAASLGLDGAQNRRFFYLGRKNIDEDTLLVEIKVDDLFVDVNDPQFFDYEATLFAEPGLAAFAFPPEYFENRNNQIRATFNYTSTSGIYILGLSIVKGSDRVFLNGALLQREADYTIDYETGALILFRQVAKEDTLRIEYEVLRGGLGGFAEYQRNLSQLSVSLQPLPWLGVNVDLFQGADIDSGEDRSRLRTMPNTHTVAGVQAVADLGDFQARALLGYNVNAFPQDDNLRENLPNHINAITSLEHRSKTFVLFAHQNGLTVFREGSWTSYTTASGMSGRTVYDITVHPHWVALATESGLTLVELEGDDPFALITNWLRFYQQDGPADNRVLSVDFDDDWLWLGTGDGLTRVNVDPGQRVFEDPEQWTSFLPERIEDMFDAPIEHLVAHDGLVYLGSERGVQVFDAASETFKTDAASRGGAVHDMQLNDGVVYVAGDWGLRLLADGRGSGWLLNNAPVFAVAVSEENVWYAPQTGLRVVGSASVPRELLDAEIRALGIVDEALWVGSVAGGPPRYTLALTRLTGGAVESFDDFQTRINGRDLGRYGDIPLGEHLNLGGIGELSLSYQLGDLSVVAALEALSDEYSAVGGRSNPGYVRWRLGSDYELAPLMSVSVEHIAGLGNPVITDTVRLSWREGIEFDADYSLELDTRREQMQSDFGLSLSESFLQDALQVRFRLDDRGSKSLSRERRSEELTLATDVEYQLGNALTLEAGLQSPLSFRDGIDPRGSLKLDGAMTWLPQLDFGTLSLDFEHENSLRFPRGGASVENRLDARMTWETLQIEDLFLAPRSTVAFEHQDRGGAGDYITLNLDNSMQARWLDLSGQLRWARDQINSSINQTENVQNQITVRADYGGFDQITPGMSWALTHIELKHTTREPKITITQQWSGNIDWSASEALNVNASLSANLTDSDEERSESWTLSSAANYRWSETLRFTASANGSLSQGVRRDDPFGTLSFDLNAGGSWDFATDWTGTFSASTLWGNDAVDPSNDYLSYIVSAQASLAF